AHVFLNNYDVVIKKMHSKYKDMLDANVDINFDAHKKEGKIKLDVLDVNFKDLGLKFQKSKKPLKISYTISNNHDIIDVARSKWRYKGKTVELDNMKIPFNLDKLTAKIPTTFVEVDALTTAFVYGTFSLKPVVAKLDVDLLSLEYSDIKMQQPSASLKIIYDKKLKIKTKEDITFSANGLRYIIKDSKIEIDDKNFNIIDTSLNIDNLASTQINTTFSFAEEKGNIILKDLKFKNKDFGDIFNSKKDIRLNISSNKTKTKISSEKFYMSFTLKEESWKLSCNSIANLAKNSKLLQDYNISNGIFSIGKDKNKKNIQFTSSIIYPYEVLVLDNEPIKEYKIKGEIEKKTKDIYFKINNVIDVNISKNIEIKAKDIGININEVFRYSNNLKTDIKDDTKQGKDIFFNAKNSYIYISKDRHAISDDMEFQYFNNAINAKLKYEKASAVFELKDKKFYLFGENFNDKFMENLFALSKLKDGVLSFSISGSTEKFAGLLHVKDTTIMDYKILNNMLAFINTIPSLVTFSLPGYSKMGLEVEDAYMKFNYENNTINVENIYLNSKEMDIVGEGSANFKLDTVDLNLNLKSDLGSGFSKIPLVGFILLDGDTVSTSMNISGKLSDPDVKSLVAKDIIVAPFNIIKRVITLPFHLFGSDKEDDK
nr:AsmA-like C-terminal domain-containing protein [Sulfurimonas sp.]